MICKLYIFINSTITIHNKKENRIKNKTGRNKTKQTLLKMKRWTWNKKNGLYLKRGKLAWKVLQIIHEAPPQRLYDYKGKQIGKVARQDNTVRKSNITGHTLFTMEKYYIQENPQNKFKMFQNKMTQYWLIKAGRKENLDN